MNNTTSSTLADNQPAGAEIAVDYGLATGQAAGPRAAMARSSALARALFTQVNATNAGAPTPCDEWSVLELSQHMISVLERAAALPTGADIMAMPLLADVAVDDLASAAADATERIEVAWADDAALSLSISVPWGDFDGATMLGTYAGELCVHSWDLATALGVSPNWPEEDVAMYLGIAQMAIPADGRVEGVPFGPVAEVADDAPAIERLVAWQGRNITAWNRRQPA